MKKLLAAISLVLSMSLHAQYVPIISQYMFNDVALNPANTGNQDALSLFGNFRAQWIGIPGAPTTQSFIAHSPLRNANSSVGVQVFADQIGVDRRTGFFGSYAYRIQMKKSRLSFGIAGGLSLLKSNNSQLNVVDAGDNLLTDAPLGILPDVSFGMSLNAKKYFVSFSIPMFLSHTSNGSKIKVINDFNDYNFMLGGGVAFDIGRNKRLIPSILLKYRIGGLPQADIDLMAELGKLFEVGLSYRTQESIIGLVKFNANKQLAIMYSFGMPVTPIGQRQFGSHELGIRYNFLYKTKITNARYLGW